MSRESSPRNSREADEFGMPRRRVLQGLGAAGVGAVITSSAQAGAALQAETPPGDDSEGEIPISTQFYSFRDTGLSTAELIYEAADAGYDAFETWRVGADTDTGPILDAMDDTGLEMSSAHISLNQVENNTEAMINTFTELGNPILIDPGVGPSAGWGDEASVIDLAERFNAAADLLSDTDLELAHHNHDSEFAQIGDTTGYDIFAENLNDDVQIQLDVGWAYVGGVDPIRFIVDHPEVVRTLHMKNMTADGEFTEIHEGDVNMRAVATAFRNTGDTDYLVFEHDAPDEPLESMQIGADWLERLNQPWEPGGICAIPGADVHPAKLHSA